LESTRYIDTDYKPVNPPLVVAEPGAVMRDPDRWQPLALSHQVSQNGIPIPGNVQVFVAPQWARVASFAADFDALLPGPPPRLHDPDTDAAFKQAAVDVIRASSELTPDDGVEIDISPASLGNNPLGTNDGGGYPHNPATGQPYAPEIVRRGDFRRVIAEFWADGPQSETPPGHWNQIAQNVAFSQNLSLTDSARMFALLNIGMADAGILSWDAKYVFNFWRPVTAYGAGGGNSDLQGDATWTPFATTPNHPEFPSAHNCFTGAVTTLIAGYFGTTKIHLVVDSLAFQDGVHTHTFDDTRDVMDEVFWARLYAGIHFYHSLEVGRDLGVTVARALLRTHFGPQGSDPEIRSSEGNTRQE
jgi:hypothetical protein